LNILYVGTLPPHHGGSAITAAQLLSALAARGHDVRAIAAVTEATHADAERFDRTHPELDVRRFVVPVFEISPDVPPAPGYRELEGSQVRALCAEAVADRRPDVLFSGRESVAWHLPELAREFEVPVLQRIAGTVTLGILRGTFPAAKGRGRFSAGSAVQTPSWLPQSTSRWRSTNSASRACT
jgi:hypothetical protein